MNAVQNNRIIKWYLPEFNPIAFQSQVLELACYAKAKCLMEIFKTSLAFRDGEIFDTQKYGQCISEKATTIERVKFFLTAFIFRNKLSGNVSIEIKNQKLYVDCMIKPKKFEKEMHRKLLARYPVAERDKS